MDAGLSAKIQAVLLSFMRWRILVIVMGAGSVKLFLVLETVARKQRCVVRKIYPQQEAVFYANPNEFYVLMDALREGCYF